MLKSNERIDTLETMVREKIQECNKLNSEISNMMAQIEKEVIKSKLYLPLDEFKAQIKTGDKFESICIVDEFDTVDKIYADTVFEANLNNKNIIYFSDCDSYMGYIDLDTGEYISYLLGHKTEHDKIIGIVDYIKNED